MKLVDMFRKTLRGRLPAVEDREARQLRAWHDRLAAADAEIERRRTNEERLRERIQKLRRRLAKVQTVASARRIDAGRYRHRVLSPQVLRDLLPARRAQLSSRAGARDASNRESRLLGVSEAYRAALTAVPPGEGAHKIELDGLAWWVPVGPAGATRLARVLGKEALPFRAVLHTREVCTGGIMLDLGAHDGSTAIPRVLLGDVEACYCAEPDPLNYACLVANTVENGLRGFVLPDRIAIGDANGTARLQRVTASRGHQVTRAEAAGAANIIDVPMRTVDAWVQDLALDPHAITFVKADIQGSEVHMLRGAPALLARRHIAWQIEFCPELIAEGGSSPRDLFSILERHFTHFIDLHPTARGARSRPIAEVQAALDYLEGDQSTDLIVYSALQA